MLSILKLVAFLRIEFPLTSNDQGLLSSLEFLIGEKTVGRMLCPDCQNSSPGIGPKTNEPV